MPSKKPKRRQLSKDFAWRRKQIRSTAESGAANQTPLVRLNFMWHWSQLQMVWQAAKKMDISLEAFLRFASYARAIKVLIEADPKPIEHEREKEWISYKYSKLKRHSKRPDILPFNWRWRKQALAVIKQAAERSKCDYRTFIIVATYESACEIADPKDS